MGSDFGSCHQPGFEENRAAAHLPGSDGPLLQRGNGGRKLVRAKLVLSKQTRQEYVNVKPPSSEKEKQLSKQATKKATKLFNYTSGPALRDAQQEDVYSKAN